MKNLKLYVQIYFLSSQIKFRKSKWLLFFNIKFDIGEARKQRGVFCTLVTHFPVIQVLQIEKNPARKWNKTFFFLKQKWKLQKSFARKWNKTWSKFLIKFTAEKKKRPLSLGLEEWHSGPNIGPYCIFKSGWLIINVALFLGEKTL